MKFHNFHTKGYMKRKKVLYGHWNLIEFFMQKKKYKCENELNLNLVQVQTDKE